jgi:hypothetical protein
VGRTDEQVRLKLPAKVPRKTLFDNEDPLVLLQEDEQRRRAARRTGVASTRKASHGASLFSSQVGKR